MVITNQRTGKPFATKYAHRVLGRSREVVDTAWPGDVVGLVNATSLRVGDSLFAEEPVRFPDIPRFSPELFAVARAKDPGRYKQFRRGIEQLEHEGVVQVLRSDLRGDQAPVLAAVGALQFEVAAQRLGTEFNAPDLARLTCPTPWPWPWPPESTGRPETFRGGEIMRRADGEIIAVFGDKWKVGHFRKDYPAWYLSRSAPPSTRPPSGSAAPNKTAGPVVPGPPLFALLLLCAVTSPCCYFSVLLRGDTAGAGRTRLGGLFALDVLLHERRQPGIVGGIDLELQAPRGGRDWGLLVGMRAQDHVAAGADEVGERIDLGRGQIGLVADPDGAVLEGVDGVRVGHRLGVDAAVEPDGLWSPPTGGDCS
jgi:hypothetical protein